MTRIVFATKRKDGTYRYRDAWPKSEAPGQLPPESVQHYVEYHPERVVKYSGDYIGTDLKFHTGKPYSELRKSSLYATSVYCGFIRRYAESARALTPDDEQRIQAIDAELNELRRRREVLLSNAYANGAPVWEEDAEAWAKVKPAESQGDSDA